VFSFFASDFISDAPDFSAFIANEQPKLDNLLATIPDTFSVVAHAHSAVSKTVALSVVCRNLFNGGEFALDNKQQATTNASGSSFDVFIYYYNI